jgi:hypothetical protein
MRVEIKQEESQSTTPRVAWNKGIPISEAARDKMSQGMKNKWKDPEYRAQMSSCLKGKTAWNKGRRMSDETREKMRQAKLNHQVSRETRQKMSLARRGKSLSPEAAARVSARLAGKSKSDEHKAAIAATQRRRHAAIRVLHAVEDVYKGSETSSEGGNGGSTKSQSHKPLPRSARLKSDRILDAFKTELREYRALQEELSPWTKAFQERHGRKPTMLDVQRTGIEWLVSRYKQYIVLRDRLFNETSILRSRLTEEGKLSAAAAGGLGHGQPPQSLSLPKSLTLTNANGPTPLARSVMATRVASALSYKAKHCEVPTCVATEAIVDSEDDNDAEEDEEEDDDEEGTSALSIPQSAGQSAKTVAKVQVAGVNPRVKAAMMAAMEYRKRKAYVTKTKAEAAAILAKTKSDRGKGTLELKSVSLPASSTLFPNSAAVSGQDWSLKDVHQAHVLAQQALEDMKRAEEDVRKALSLSSVDEDDIRQAYDGGEACSDRHQHVDDDIVVRLGS